MTDIINMIGGPVAGAIVPVVGTMGLLALTAAVTYFTYKRKKIPIISDVLAKGKFKKDAQWVGSAALICACLAVGAFGGLNFGSLTAGGGSNGIQLITDGEAATVGINTFTGSWGNAGSQTEVYDIYTVKDDAGSTLVSDAVANSTSTAVGRTITVWSTGASYYFEPVTFKVESETSNVPDIHANAVIDSTDGAIVVYDETGSSALTADDGTNNTADYAGGSLGAGEEYVYFVKYRNADADKSFKLGAVCTYYCGAEVDDFTMEESGWTEVSVPSGDMQTAFTAYDDANDTTSCNYKHCYVPSAPIMLNEWDSVKYEFVIDTDDSVGPSANGDTYVGGVFLDTACESDMSGNIVCDWYKHNTDADPGDVGLDENPETTADGLDQAFCIEPQ